tara:strand:- start:2503 stop:3105 length:603 start_codon:yes stop_codon:yes gene_type:complete
MANYYQDNGNAWASKSFNGYSEQDSDYERMYGEYFNGDGTLKSGYTQREIGSNSNIGEVATYGQQTEDDDDGESQSWNYGIFKTPQQKAAPAPAPTPAPTPAPKPQPKPQPTGPVEHSPEIKQAKERVNKYESNIKDGTTSENYAKDSYINRDSKRFNQYNFASKTFDGASDNSKLNSQDFFSKKKNNLTSSPEYKEFMQ